jgi:hypothetical protein
MIALDVLPMPGGPCKMIIFDLVNSKVSTFSAKLFTLEKGMRVESISFESLLAFI